MPKSKNPKSTQKPPARVRVPSAKAKASKETPAKQQQSSGKKSKKTKARNDMMGNEDELVKGSDDEPNEDDGDKVKCVFF